MKISKKQLKSMIMEELQSVIVEFQTPSGMTTIDDRADIADAYFDRNVYSGAGGYRYAQDDDGGFVFQDNSGKYGYAAPGSAAYRSISSEIAGKGSLYKEPAAADFSVGQPAGSPTPRIAFPSAGPPAQSSLGPDISLDDVFDDADRLDGVGQPITTASTPMGTRAFRQGARDEIRATRGSRNDKTTGREETIERGAEFRQQRQLGRELDAGQRQYARGANIARRVGDRIERRGGPTTRDTIRQSRAQDLKQRGGDRQAAAFMRGQGPSGERAFAADPRLPDPARRDIEEMIYEALLEEFGK